MTMNSNTLNPGRLVRYIGYEIVTYLPRTVKLLFAVCSFQVLVWLISAINGITGTDLFYIEDGAFINNPFVLMGLTGIVAALSPYLAYRNINDPKTGYSYAMLPASGTEKYISMLVISLVIVPFGALACIFLTDALLALLSMAGLGGFREFAFRLGVDMEIFNPWNFLHYMLLLCIPVFFTTFFRRNKILYSILTVIVFALVIGFLQSVFFVDTITRLSENAVAGTIQVSADPVNGLQVTEEESLSAIRAAVDRYHIFTRLTFYITTLFCLVCTWFNIRKFRY